MNVPQYQAYHTTDSQIGTQVSDYDNAAKLEAT